MSRHWGCLRDFAERDELVASGLRQSKADLRIVFDTLAAIAGRWPADFSCRGRTLRRR